MSTSFKLTIISFVLAFLTFASAEEGRSSRARRFCCGQGSGMTMLGGKIGCVVSQSKLFINGLFIKDLSEDEQQELSLYKDAQKQFKDKIHQYLEQRFNASNEEEVEQLQKPESPKKPSFCSEKATTQFVFDGCVVQGDSVYIGNNFVRKLSADEQQQLEEFDQKFTSYQEAVNNQIRQQVEDTFGKQFGNLFGPQLGSSSGAKSNNSTNTNNASSNQQSSELSDGKKMAIPEQPKSPDFCTMII